MSYKEETLLLQLKRRVVVLEVWLSGKAILKCILRYVKKSLLQLCITIVSASLFLSSKIAVVQQEHQKSVTEISLIDFHIFSSSILFNMQY